MHFLNTPLWRTSLFKQFYFHLPFQVPEKSQYTIVISTKFWKPHLTRIKFLIFFLKTRAALGRLCPIINRITLTTIKSHSFWVVYFKFPRRQSFGCNIRVVCKHAFSVHVCFDRDRTKSRMWQVNTLHGLLTISMIYKSVSRTYSPANLRHSHVICWWRFKGFPRNVCYFDVTSSRYLCRNLK